MKALTPFVAILLVPVWFVAAESELPDLAKIKIAAESGDPVAQVQLSQRYQSQGDYVSAEMWYRKAAYNNSDAQVKLAQLLMRDVPIKKANKVTIRKADPTEAVKWFRKAADNNHPKAQLYLGECYRDGKGVNRDLVEAYKWFAVSAKNGNIFATGRLDQVTLKLTTQQIAEGKRRADTFLLHVTPKTRPAPSSPK